MTGFDSKRRIAMDRLDDDDIQIYAQPSRKRPIEADYASQVAYTRALELFCDTLAQPVQEPVSMRMPKVGDKVICIEDESLGEVVSLTAGGSPDIKFADGSHGTYLLREFAELFGYVTSPLPVQRPWVGLTDEDWGWVADKEGTSLDTFAHGVAWAQTRLKEKNT